jgi:hypothetical protein
MLRKSPRDDEKGRRRRARLSSETRLSNGIASLSMGELVKSDREASRPQQSGTYKFDPELPDKSLTNGASFPTGTRPTAIVRINSQFCGVVTSTIIHVS